MLYRFNAFFIFFDIFGIFLFSNPTEVL